MSIKLIRAALMVLFGFLVVLPSWADDFPTSVNPATGKWERMRPTSFSPTLASAIEQCNRTASADADDRLTPAMCVRFEAMLRAGECRKALVRDGVVFDHMNGRHGGHSRLTHNVEKALGRLDPALICDLGEHVHAYWFVGKKGESCNNVGFVFAAIPPAPVDGVCGSNAKHFTYDVTDWPAQGNFCAVGEQSSPSILFPQAGRSTLWSCQGPNGGARVPCEGKREAPPKKAEVPPAKGLTCSPVKYRYIVPTPGQIVSIPGLSVPVCRGQVPIPDTFVNLPASVTVVTREEPFCK
jgi:hypothetical protein